MSNIILYLTYDGLADNIGQSQILPYLLGCSNKGFNFHVLSFEKKRQASIILKIEKQLSQKSIIWYKLNFTVGRNIIYKLYDFIRFISTAIIISKKNEYRLIHSRSYFASSVGLVISFLFGIPIVFDKRDFWIDALLESGRLRPSNYAHSIIYRVLRYCENRLFLSSKHVISLTNVAKQIVLDRYSSRVADNTSVIPCCVDLSMFDKHKISSEQIKLMKERFNLENSFVLGYVGSIDVAYMIEEMFDCFKIMKQYIENAKFLMVVNNGKNYIFGTAASKNIPKEDMIIVNSLRADVPSYISLFDCGLFFITPNFAKKASSPTKLFEILAMNKPVITNSGIGDVDEIFAKLECGYLTRNFHENDYSAACDWLLQNRYNEFNYDLSNYSLDAGVDKYSYIYRKLLNETHNYEPNSVVGPISF